MIFYLLKKLRFSLGFFINCRLLGFFFLTLICVESAHSVSFSDNTRRWSGIAYTLSAIIDWSAERENIPSPCVGYTYCAVGIALRYPDGRVVAHSSWVVLEGKDFTYATTLGLYVHFRTAHTYPKATINFSGPDVVPEGTCFIMAYMTNVRVGVMPDAHCTINGTETGTPNPNVCSISGDYILSYGNVAISDVNGLQRTATSILKCTKDGRITVTAKPNNGSFVPLRSDFSLRATLEVNEKDGNVGVPIVVTANVPVSIAVRSTLKKVGDVVAGPFSGSATVYVFID